jgi:hypothetical protein
MRCAEGNDFREWPPKKNPSEPTEPSTNNGLKPTEPSHRGRLETTEPSTNNGSKPKKPSFSDGFFCRAGPTALPPVFQF